MRTLTTDRLILRPFRPDDEAIHELVFAGHSDLLEREDAWVLVNR